jgi:CheY-like chemotaxis protein
MRILVVDDSRTMRMLVIRTLRQAGYGDYEMVEAGDGIEALDVMRQSQVDVVLCDWNMPRMSGLELLKELRGAGDLRLFGFITSESTAQMRGLAETEGAAFVISKPFTAETFQAVLGGMDVAQQVSYVHEGLPVARDLQLRLEPLMGRAVEVTPSREGVSPELAAVTWTYVFPDGGLAAVGAMDLPLAAALSTGFGMWPIGRMHDSIGSGRLSPEQLDNLHEVLNVLVSLYASMTDLHIGLGDVYGTFPDRPEIGKVLQQSVGRLDATMQLPGYGGGLISSVYALRG